MAETIAGPAGRLEIAVRGAGDPAARWLVICHPHPQYGGSMHNNVMDALARAGEAAGRAVLAFNFRGVGASDGAFAGGAGECDDLLAVLDHVADARNCPADRIAVAGYSFGALVSALSLERGAGPAGVLWVSPPISMAPIGDAARDWAGVKHLVVGGRDTFCRPADARAFCEAAVPPIAFHEVPGADHFYMGYEDDVEAAAADFLRALDAVRS